MCGCTYYLCAADLKALCVILLSIISRNQAQSYHNKDMAWPVLTHTYISRNRKGTESASFRLCMGIHLSSEQYYVMLCVCVWLTDRNSEGKRDFQILYKAIFI